MNERNDKDLREALRRHEAKRVKPQVSEDFCDKVMQTIAETESASSKQSKHRRVWIYAAIGAAAAITLLLSLNIDLNDQDGKRQNHVCLRQLRTRVG